MTPDQTNITLGAYALNLLHGAELADFERENLIALAAAAGSKVTPALEAMAQHREHRIAAQKAERERLRDALILCRDQFRRYQQLHALKPDGQGQEKAKVNGDMADMCESALQGFTSG